MMKCGLTGAAAYAAGGLLFLGIAALNFWEGELFLGTAVLALDWLWLCLGMFLSGYRCGSAQQEQAEIRRKEAESGEEHCPVCGCTVYLPAAGRRVCACCGTVWSHGPEV